MRQASLRGFVQLAIVLGVFAMAFPVDAEPITLRFLIADYWGQPWTSVQVALVQEWNQANPDIQVELIRGTSGYANLHGRIQTLIAQGQQVDIYENNREWTASLLKQGLLLDLLPLLERDGLLEEYASEFGIDPSSVRQQREAYGAFFSALPSFGVIDSGLIYDKELFAEAGVPLPPDSWTWDEFRQTAGYLTRPSFDAAQTQYGFIDEEQFFYQWLWQNGVMSMWSKDETGNIHFELGSDASRETIGFLASLHRDGFARYHKGLIQNDFGRGRGAMRMGQFSVLSTLKQSGINASITRRPYNTEEVAFSGDVWFHLHLVRSGDPEREAAAWEFLKWRTSREIDLQAAIRIGMFPWRRSNLTSNEFRIALEGMEFRDEAMLMADYMFEAGRLIIRPDATFRSGAAPNLGNFLVRAITGELPIDEAIERATQAFYADLVR